MNKEFVEKISPGRWKEGSCVPMGVCKEPPYQPPYEVDGRNDHDGKGRHRQQHRDEADAEDNVDARVTIYDVRP